MRARYFYGWNVVGATFAMALFSFGLGFYGLTVYLATLQRLHGWSASAVSAPVTVYYVAGALLTAAIGDVYGSALGRWWEQVPWPWRPGSRRLGSSPSRGSSIRPSS